MQSLPQSDSFPGSSFFLTNSGPGMPLKTLQVDLQGNAQAYSSVFTDRRSSFFDSGLSAWCAHPFPTTSAMLLPGLAHHLIIICSLQRC